MTKERLRKIYLDKRKNLSSAEVASLSLQLYHLFFSSFDLSFTKVIHTYLPIIKNNEPDTWIILDRIRREFPHVRISLPKVSPAGTLENFYFEGLHQLQENHWGIQEPRQGTPTPAEKIDMVLVPLLTFDISGNRVGYGKGFYDKFLKTCRKDCQKIGLSFSAPVDKIADIDPFDVPLTSCITPTEVFSF